MDSPALPPLPAGLCPTLPLVRSLARSRARAVGFGWCAGERERPSVGGSAGRRRAAGGHIETLFRSARGTPTVAVPRRAARRAPQRRPGEGARAGRPSVHPPAPSRPPLPTTAMSDNPFGNPSPFGPSGGGGGGGDDNPFGDEPNPFADPATQDAGAPEPAPSAATLEADPGPPAAGTFFKPSAASKAGTRGGKPAGSPGIGSKGGCDSAAGATGAASGPAPARVLAVCALRARACVVVLWWVGEARAPLAWRRRGREAETCADAPLAPALGAALRWPPLRDPSARPCAHYQCSQRIFVRIGRPHELLGRWQLLRGRRCGPAAARGCPRAPRGSVAQARGRATLARRRQGQELAEVLPPHVPRHRGRGACALASARATRPSRRACSLFLSLSLSVPPSHVFARAGGSSVRCSGAVAPSADEPPHGPRAHARALALTPRRADSR